MDIYIIIRNIYFPNDGRFHQLTKDNPVLGAYKELSEAERVLNDLIERRKVKFPEIRVTLTHPSSYCVSKYVLDDDDIKEYAIYKEFVL